MNRREPRQHMDDAIFCWYFCWYLFPSAGDEKSRYQQEVSMPLTDSRGKALYGRARKGEKVDKEADGGGLNLQGGKYRDSPVALPESGKPCPSECPRMYL